MITWTERKLSLLYKWSILNYVPRYWSFVRGIHRSPVNSSHKGQWRGALMFSLSCVWINGWVNNRDAGDLRRYRAHYDVIVIVSCLASMCQQSVKTRYIQQWFDYLANPQTDHNTEIGKVSMRETFHHEMFWDSNIISLQSDSRPFQIIVMVIIEGHFRHLRAVFYL